jgi:hypothetical protein
MWTDVFKRALIKAASANSDMSIKAKELSDSMLLYLVQDFMWYLDNQVDREIKIELVQLLERCKYEEERYEIIKLLCENLA